MPRPPSELTQMKAASHAALQRALTTCPEMDATLHRWWNETQAATARRPAAQAAIMFQRTARLYELLVDRKSWPGLR
jgi:hypothetical protein